MKYQETKETLNQLVADLSQMAMIIHQTHWYMRGTNFLKLHPLMDQFMDEINDQLSTVNLIRPLKKSQPIRKLKTGQETLIKQRQNGLRI